MSTETRHLILKGMQCPGCESVVEQALEALPGVRQAKASYASAAVDIVFDGKEIGLGRIVSALRAKGYAATLSPGAEPGSWLNWLVFPLLLTVVAGVTLWGRSQLDVLTELNAQMNAVMVLGVGFLTGFHCIGMCGSLVVNYSVADPPRSRTAQTLAHLLYGGGKTLSYAAIGAAFGLMGALVAITPLMRGMAALASGIFLVVFGLRMLASFAWLRRVGLPIPKILVRQIAGQLRKQQHPLMTGLLSGLLLGCGPLQALYLLAAGTGSPVEGARLLSLFGLGTLPPLLGFGIFANLIPRLAVRHIVRVSGLLVLLMGLMMTDRGLRLTESGYDFVTVVNRVSGTTLIAPPDRPAAGHHCL